MRINARNRAARWATVVTGMAAVATPWLSRSRKQTLPRPGPRRLA
jgi:hypothetical protein